MFSLKVPSDILKTSVYRMAVLCYLIRQSKALQLGVKKRNIRSNQARVHFYNKHTKISD